MGWVDYFGRFIFLPFLEEIFEQFGKKRFSNQTKHTTKLSLLLLYNINSTPNEYYEDIKEAFNFWQPVLLGRIAEQQVIGEWDVRLR